VSICTEKSFGTHEFFRIIVVFLFSLLYSSFHCCIPLSIVVFLLVLLYSSYHCCIPLFIVVFLFSLLYSSWYCCIPLSIVVFLLSLLYSSFRVLCRLTIHSTGIHSRLQVIFRKRATNYRALLRKMTCKDTA